MAIQGEGARFEVMRFEGSDEQVSAAWLQARRAGVGGSDVAAIMGLSTYKGAYTLWAEKSGLAEPEDISDRPAVHWGNVLEPVVGAEYRANHPGREVRRVNGLCRSVERPWALASLDYEVRDEGGTWGVLEIKTVGFRRAPDWDEGVPVYYQTQVQHYLDVTGRPYCDVAVLVAGQDYREYRIEADAEDQAAVRRAVDAFWAMVSSGEAPDPCACDSGALLKACGEGEGMLEEADASDVPELAAWLAAKARADAAKGALDEATAALKGRIGAARGIEVPQGRVVWSRGKRRSFDRKRFDADMPGVYELYQTEREADMGLRYTERKA